MTVNVKESWFPRRGRVGLALSLALSGLAGYLAVSWATQPANPASVPPPTIPIQPATLLVCRDDNLDFGTIEPGGYREAIVWLENPGPDPVEIAAVRTSCDCFEVTVERKVVEAGDRVKAVAKVDFRDDTRYRGKLLLEAEGVGKDKEAYPFLIK